MVSRLDELELLLVAVEKLLQGVRRDVVEQSGYGIPQLVMGHIGFVVCGFDSADIDDVCVAQELWLEAG